MHAWKGTGLFTKNQALKRHDSFASPQSFTKSEHETRNTKPET